MSNKRNIRRITSEKLRELRNAEIGRNIFLIKMWQLILDIPITNENINDINYKNVLDRERVNIRRLFNQQVSPYLITDTESNKHNIQLMNRFFDRVIDSNPYFKQIYNYLDTVFSRELYRIEIIYRDINGNPMVVLNQVNNPTFFDNLKSNLLSYFLRLEYRITETPEDSNGYAADGLISNNYFPINVFLEFLGDEIKTRTGGIFTRINNTGYDLSRYQIFSNEILLREQPHCLYNCLYNYFTSGGKDVHGNTGEEVLLGKKDKLLKLMNKIDEKGNIATKDIRTIAIFVGIKFKIYTPKKISGIYQLTDYDNSTYPYNTRYTHYPTVSLSIIDNHYINHEKANLYIKPITGHPARPLNIKRKALTTTRFICEKFNEGYFKQHHNLVDVDKYRKEELSSLNFMDDEQKPFGKKDASKVFKSESKNLKRIINEYLNRCSDEIRNKYLDLTTGEYSKIKIWQIGIKDFYCDTEAMFDNEEHIPYSIGKLGDDNVVKIFHNDPNDWDNPEFIKLFLNDFPKEKINYIHFHNAKYDHGLLQKIGLGDLVSICEKETSLYCVEFFYNDRYFIIYDTYKKIPRSLKDICNMFSLTSSKIEYTLHELHTIEAMKKNNLDYRIIRYSDINNKHIKYMANEKGVNKLSQLPEYKIVDDVRVYYEYIVIDDRVVVTSNYLQVMKAKYFENGMFKHKQYFDDYLKVDCIVLRDAMERFHILMTEIMGNNYRRYAMTLSSIADLYACASGAYKETYTMTGQLRNFCKKASRGGRVCTAYNRPINTFIKLAGMNIKIEDFDATSLYPSAIVKLKELFGGIPVGKAIKTDVLQLNKFGIYKVKIDELRKPKAIPMVAEEDNGTINWTNDIVGKELYLDYFAISDLMYHQKAKITILEGSYWDKYDPKLCDITQELFNKRLGYIQLKNTEMSKPNPDKNIINKYAAISELIKLIMNSIYGKTALKKSNRTLKVSTEEDYVEYCKTFYDRVRPMMSPILKNLEGETLIQYNIFNNNEHHNRQHIACAVLGCSKYIMNQFSSVAEKIGLYVYYTDTDSLHVCTEHPDYITRLAKYNYGPGRNGSVILQEEYAKIYDENPIGPTLGKFKSDFKMSNPKLKNIYSVGMIANGKKNYCHLLRGEDSDGNIEYEVSTTMKGISEKALQYHCNKYYNGNKLEFYHRVYYGQAIKIDMLADKTLVSFDVKMGSIKHKDKFSRVVSIVNEWQRAFIVADHKAGKSKTELVEKYKLPESVIKKYL